MTHEEVLAELARRAAGDTDYRNGRVFSLVYHAGEAHEQLLAKAHAIYASANLLNPLANGGCGALSNLAFGTAQPSTFYADDVLHGWALQGRGLSLEALWDVAEDLQSGRLVACLSQYRCDEIELFAVFQPGHPIPPRVRLFVDFTAASRLSAWP